MTNLPVGGSGHACTGHTATRSRVQTSAITWACPMLPHGRRLCAMPSPLHAVKGVIGPTCSAPPGVQHVTRGQARHQACSMPPGMQHATNRRHATKPTRHQASVPTNQPTCDQPITWLVSPTNQPPQRLVGRTKVGWSPTTHRSLTVQQSVGHGFPRTYLDFTKNEEVQSFTESPVAPRGGGASPPSSPVQ